jgi:hypothetical protein
MVNRLRIIAMWAALSPFGVIVVTGQGLHLLPGMGHRCGDPRCGPDACSTAACPTRVGHHAGQACCHPCGHRDPVEPPSTPDGRFSAAPALADGRACPICRFFATAKPLFGEVGPVEFGTTVTSAQAADAPRPPKLSAAVYQSRAPPREVFSD